MGNGGSTMRHDETMVMVARPLLPGGRRRRAGAGPAARRRTGLGSGRLGAGVAIPRCACPPGRPGPARTGWQPARRRKRDRRGLRRLAARVLDACRIQRATIAGLSLGTAVALRTALDAPGRVEKLALLAAAEVSDRELAGITCPELLLGHRRPCDAPEQIVMKLVAFLTRGTTDNQ